ncbi:MAG: MmgE/PrpD family protein [Hyphomicrobiales bacterium]|nr:MmgE/PrpD family protein [Hyphomicrobiales bacterium]
MADDRQSAAASQIIAAWIEQLSIEAIPGAAKSASVNTVIDTAGLIIAALETDYGRAVRAAFPEAGPCTIFGLAEGRSFSAAAVINGTCGHGEDYDNTFEGCPVHSGVVIVPALAAAGEGLGLSNADVGKGIVVGMEIMCRLGLVAKKAVHAAGFHPTAILGTMAAAAGVAAATGQNRTQIKDTLGVAGSMAAGIIEYLADGSWTKRMHAGWAAQSGLNAAMMGAAGFVGPRTVFEGTHGLFSAFAPSLEPDFGPLTDGLGDRWEAANAAFKPYACGTMTQPYIDCAVRLAGRGIAAGDIAAIECEVGEGTVHRLWEPLALKHRPPTPYAAKFSTPYCVAVGLLRGGAGLAEFTEEAVSDPAVLDLASRVTYQIDPDNEYPDNYTGHVRLKMRDGSVVEERQAQMRGGMREPMSEDELVAKCRANLAFAGLSGKAAERVRGFADDIFASELPFTAAVLRKLA